MSENHINHYSKEDFSKKLNRLAWKVNGKVSEVIGNVIEAELPSCKLGTICEIDVGQGQGPLLAEVIGFRNNRTLLMAYSEISGIHVGAVVRERSTFDQVNVGRHLLGKVLDPFLVPLDESILDEWDPKAQKVPIEKAAPNPMLRQRIERPLGLGIRAIDGLLTFGEGQRIGIMAGSGVGKSVLMGMIARGSESDINVIALIGERGREVREFIEKELGPEGLKKSVVIVVTSDQSPLTRLRGAKVATAVAEYFSSKGQKILLMMDSLTRVAQAQREIGLSAGEAPASKAYPPSVFSMLPRLLERTGPQKEGHGSISGLYTVLVDGDDFNDPLPDAVRSILDGHINLSRKLANRGHFPAIEVTSSVSRVMQDITSLEQRKMAQSIKALISEYEENFDYIQMGTYQQGSNQMLDAAVALMPVINAYLHQPMEYLSDLKEAVQGLVAIFQNAGKGQ